MAKDWEKSEATRTRACSNCAAELVFSARTGSTTCEYCGFVEEIVASGEEFRELELRPYLEDMEGQSLEREVRMLHCGNCGANLQIDANLQSLHCVYCSEPLVLEDSSIEQWIVPGAVLPFSVTDSQAQQKFKQWVKGLWFAPNKLKKAGLSPDRIQGVYLPYWTFDADLQAVYSGQRGDNYTTTERVQYQENGQTKTRTKNVIRTRWTAVSGQVSGKVDDTLVDAAKQRQVPQAVATWNLDDLKTFDSQYLSGFTTENYSISLREGHIESHAKARSIATRWASSKIGGDQQRVDSIQLSFTNETFKHILLPMYVSSFRYQDKPYQFFVNGQTGAVDAQRPYSKWKIAGAVVLVLAAIVLYASMAG